MEGTSYANSFRERLGRLRKSDKLVSFEELNLAQNHLTQIINSNSPQSWLQTDLNQLPDTTLPLLICHICLAQELNKGPLMEKLEFILGCLRSKCDNRLNVDISPDNFISNSTANGMNQFDADQFVKERMTRMLLLPSQVADNRLIETMEILNKIINSKDAAGFLDQNKSLFPTELAPLIIHHIGTAYQEDNNLLAEVLEMILANYNLGLDSVEHSIQLPKFQEEKLPSKKDYSIANSDTPPDLEPNAAPQI